jgi:hypothetical protein
MLVAAVNVHVQKGFFAQNGSYEYTLVLGIAALTTAFTGTGLAIARRGARTFRGRCTLGRGGIFLRPAGWSISTRRAQTGTAKRTAEESCLGF